MRESHTTFYHRCFICEERPQLLEVPVIQLRRCIFG
ncbi:hypothetical protein BIW11_02582 [Tropilaelaps mercedesae]|uniref:Uncharacterized protein n=1 Tax=Tropilaelaps mercedesae TaxID=418985 RepID=A0A1V9Y0L2_9ACAR|nr:hypothetical protein BIW11_02582 [Tropilaelaps mercedesae]